MLEKTRGIVLFQIKYTDSGIIVHLFTREFGRLAVLIKGMRKKNSGKHNAMLQPMSLLDIEFYNKPTREIQLLKEFSLSVSFYNIYSNIRKSTVALFLGEVLASVLPEENQQHELFDYIERSLLWFDESTERYANFHISFLCGLSSYLGFEPSGMKDGENAFFDMLNGKFISRQPYHEAYSSGTSAGMLSLFFKSSHEESASITLTGRERNEIVETIVRYYSLHLPSLRRINSLEVLKEVFE